MPVLRYFVFVGGALLALLIAVSLALPTPPATGTLASGDLPVIRIHSDQKLPERVVIDTTQPTILPPATVTASVVAPPPPASLSAEMSAKAHVREAFAQFVPSSKAASAASKIETQHRPKRKVARARPSGTPMMLVAQQPHFGLFNTTW